MKHLVLLGAGHAHLTAIRELATLTDTRATVVSAGEYHYYSGMGPGFLSGRYTEDDIRFHVPGLVQPSGAELVIARAMGIDADSRQLHLDNGQTLDYDVLSLNVGSTVRALPMEPDSDGGRLPRVFTAKPIEELVRARKWMLDRLAGSKLTCPRVCVIGGGAAGVEIAGNLDALIASLFNTGQNRPSPDGGPFVTLLAGSRLMKRFPNRARRLVMANYARRGIRVLEGDRAVALAPGGVRLASGHVAEADLVLFATGVQPSGLLATSSLATSSGGWLLVDRHLRSLSHPEVLGGGDCIAMQDAPLDKVGVHAVRQNPILLDNLKAALEGGDMTAYHGINRYMLLINLGDGTAVFIRGNLVLGGPLLGSSLPGRLFMGLKDRIDRDFMRRFKQSPSPRS